MRWCYSSPSSKYYCLSFSYIAVVIIRLFIIVVIVMVGLFVLSFSLFWALQVLSLATFQSSLMEFMGFQSCYLALLEVSFQFFSLYKLLHVILTEELVESLVPARAGPAKPSGRSLLLGWPRGGGDQGMRI